MSELEILEGNELIVKFMGHELDAEGYWMIGTCHYCYADDYSRIHTSELRFHDSWDWLMPVVNKCYMLQHNKGWSKSNCLQYILVASDFMCEDAITIIYKEIVNYIKWHNAYVGT